MRIGWCGQARKILEQPDPHFVVGSAVWAIGLLVLAMVLAARLLGW